MVTSAALFDPQNNSVRYIEMGGGERRNVITGVLATSRRLWRGIRGMAMMLAAESHHFQ